MSIHHPIYRLLYIDNQRAIVTQTEEEQRLVNASKELIRIFEQKIKSTIKMKSGRSCLTLWDCKKLSPRCGDN